MEDDRYEILAKEIRLALEEGASQLENLAQRTVVIHLVKYLGISCNPPVETLEPWDLMKGLGQCMIGTWPDSFSLSTFEGIEQKLPSLRKVREALKTPDLNQWVAIFPDQGRIADPRVPLSKFKNQLWEAVLAARI